MPLKPSMQCQSQVKTKHTTLSYRTPDGIYACKVLPMGTRNSPALFAEYVTKILEDIRHQYPGKIMNYQDDIIISGSSLEETLTITKLERYGTPRTYYKQTKQLRSYFN
eukprot:GHVP01047862.1.p1 GENE.GHVP01047862.1~~GHVP01047862.1.p1  ORF type:complete len:109 (-),score=5.70 GHVP01047862.1:312-638(-)